ncbi:charged multivesicular body protein 7 [Sabethes cyaneus]|uniref:charged multivesicular body protein 7 n=1 Tax=Sabethes cyaneus TaxID=53552 RepID=UPI00237EC6A2|nr:charged multivesicular body protein 7 [Sabethes cyaneus]
MSRKSVVQSSQSLYVLDDAFYPDAWRDDLRMGVYLAEFRVRSVNPENYDSKMKFWKEMIHNYCLHKGSGAVSIVELKRVFRRKGTSPYCLSTVFEDMVREGKLVAGDCFWKTPKESWSGWAVDVLMKRPLQWGFSAMKEKLVGSAQDESLEFICTGVVEEQCNLLDKLLKEQHKHNVLISKNDLHQSINSSGISSEGLDLILQRMVCQQRVFVEQHPNGEIDKKKVILKFAVPGTKALPITDIERSIYNLEQTERDLLRMIDKIEQEISDALSVVKDNIREGKKQLAKSNLKKKHLLEKNMEKKLNVLENVQTMLSRIHDSQSDQNVIEAYKLGSNALKNAFASSGITLDSVDDTLAEMKEIMDQQDEMQAMISTVPNSDIDELELEKELSDLIDLKLAESNIIPPHGLTQPSTVPAAQATLAQLNDFDKEIEKRLAALRTESTPPSSNLSVDANVSSI